MQQGDQSLGQQQCVHILAITSKMLPDILMKCLIVICSFILPSYVSLHAASQGRVDAQRRSLFYFSCYIIGNQMVMPILEPLLLRVLSPVYFELKFALFVILLLPRFRAIER